MSKKDKLEQKARSNPDGLTFKEFQTLMYQHLWNRDRQNGSHEIWLSPKNSVIAVQNNKGKAKGYQVKQFLKALDNEQ